MSAATTEEIESAARRAYQAWEGPTAPSFCTWENLHPGTQERWRRASLAVLVGFPLSEKT